MKKQAIIFSLLGTAAVALIVAMMLPRSAAAPGGVAMTRPAWGPMNPEYTAKRQRITAMLERAPTAPPTSAEAGELFAWVRDDPAFNVKVRAMAVLPFVKEREQAIDVLIEALKDRDPDSSGSGNVPLYATTYLADMQATRALPAIEDWLTFLEKQTPYRPETAASLLQKGKEDLAKLKAGQIADTWSRDEMRLAAYEASKGEQVPEGELTILRWRVMEDERPLLVEDAVVLLKTGGRWRLARLYRHPKEPVPPARWRLWTRTDAPFMNHRDFEAKPARAEIDRFLKDSEWLPLSSGFRETAGGGSFNPP